MESIRVAAHSAAALNAVSIVLRLSLYSHFLFVCHDARTTLNIWREATTLLFMVIASVTYNMPTYNKILTWIAIGGTATTLAWLGVMLALQTCPHPDDYPQMSFADTCSDVLSTESFYYNAANMCGDVSQYGCITADGTVGTGGVSDQWDDCPLLPTNAKYLTAEFISMILLFLSLLCNVVVLVLTLHYKTNGGDEEGGGNTDNEPEVELTDQAGRASPPPTTGELPNAGPGVQANTLVDIRPTMPRPGPIAQSLRLRIPTRRTMSNS